MSADGPPGSFDELNKLFAASKASPARKRRANSRVKKNAVALAAAEKAGAALWSPSKELLEDVQLDEEAARDVVGPRRQPDFTADKDEQADADAAAAAGGAYDDDCGGGGGAAEEQWPHAAAPPLLAVSFASPPGAGAGAGGTRVPVISADAQRAVGAAAARSARDVGDAAASAAALRATLREEEQLDAAASAGSLKELKRMIKGGAASRQESPSHKRARTSYREHPDAAEAGQLDAKNPRCR